MPFSPARHTFTSRNRPLSAASRPPPWRMRAPPATDRTTSSLTKIRQSRSCAPMLAITSSEIPCFCVVSFCCARRSAASAFLLIFRNRSGVVIRAPPCLDPQLFAPAAFRLFWRQAHVFRGGNFWPYASADSSSINVRRPRAVRA